ncbi:Receptor-type tyrosine-protein phosphatase gamma [Termitomyces sp. J132]|nr:Receptor-type tyrosine-protein phosphatase gamma [Termitomyces sp. J132]
MSSEPPLWLVRYSNKHYVASVLGTLATREKEREIARSTASLSLDAEQGRRSTPFSRVYGLLKLPNPVSAESKMHDHYSIAAGIHPANQHRNRYHNIQPYDRTRVVVGERYLNASWVLERSGSKWWIASQAPLPHTAHTFLSLLQPINLPFTPTNTVPPPSPPVTSRVRTIVQLTNNVEDGRRKAHPYYPTQVGQSILISPEDGDRSLPIIVTLTKLEVVEHAHCVWSTLSVMPATSNTAQRGDVPSNHDDSKEQHPVIFHHLLYTSWPDFGVPQDHDRASLLAFIKLVDQTNRNTSFDPDPPIIVHCSAGIGRTGSFIAISSLLRKFGFLPKPGIPCPASVLPHSPLGALSLEQPSDDLIVQEIDSLREQRPGMVQRNEQIILIYEILASAFRSP